MFLALQQLVGFPDHYQVMCIALPSAGTNNVRLLIAYGATRVKLSVTDHGRPGRGGLPKPVGAGHACQQHGRCERDSRLCEAR